MPVKTSRVQGLGPRIEIQSSFEFNTMYRWTWIESGINDCKAHALKGLSRVLPTIALGFRLTSAVGGKTDKRIWRYNIKRIWKWWSEYGSELWDCSVSSGCRLTIQLNTIPNSLFPFWPTYWVISNNCLEVLRTLSYNRGSNQAFSTMCLTMNIIAVYCLLLFKEQCCQMLPNDVCSYPL